MLSEEVSGRVWELMFTPLESSTAAQVEAEPRSDSAGSTFPLLQVGLGGPDGGVVGHVVVGGEEFHFLPVSTTNTVTTV